MSANPAFVVGSLCVVGGLIGFAKKRSIPSLVAGVSVGLLFLWSANNIAKGTGPGIEGALGASALLLLSSAPRAVKGPVPALLTFLGAANTFYYGRSYLAHRNATS